MSFLLRLKEWFSPATERLRRISWQIEDACEILRKHATPLQTAVVLESVASKALRLAEQDMRVLEKNPALLKYYRGVFDESVAIAEAYKALETRVFNLAEAVKEVDDLQRQAVKQLEQEDAEDIYTNVMEDRGE